MYEQHLARRLVEELILADKAPTRAQRSVHIRACRFYCQTLKLSSHAVLVGDGELPILNAAERR